MDLAQIKETKQLTSSLITHLANVMWGLENTKPIHPGNGPDRPIYATINEYNEYLVKQADYRVLVSKYNKHVDRLRAKEVHVKRILKMFPRNVWLVNDESTHAVASHVYNWGGGEYHERWKIVRSGNIQDFLTELKE